MLRVHIVQLVDNLSDPAMEDVLYENLTVQRFVGLRLSDAIPDETTILNFRHRLEAAALGRGLLEEINRHLEAEGLQLKQGTVVDASIISAPSSTRESGQSTGSRDAPDAQGKPVVLRDEVAHRGGL